MNASFEGSYRGDATRIADDAALECGICWHVYDPAIGDDVAQVPPGTPFAALPEHWCCPNCDAPKHKFMVLGAAPAGGSAGDTGGRLVAAYRKVALGMHGLPIYNPQLVVEAVGFREHGGRQIGVVVTPWFMNIVALPAADEAGDWASGRSIRIAFPSGEYEFIAGELEGIGRLASCSLFSPMNDFADHEAARLAAEAAANALFEPDTEQAATASDNASAQQRPEPAPVSRRALLGAAP